MTSPTSTAPLPFWQRVHLTVCSAAIAWCLGYVAADYTGVPRLYHFQHEHRFELRTRVSDPVPSGYIGLWLWALLGALFAGAIVFVALRFRRRPVSDRLLSLFLAWTFTAFALATGYYTWNNWP